MKKGISKISDKMDKNIHPLILRNLTPITRECFFCERKFETTIGGPRISCPHEECQRKYRELLGEVKHMPLHRVCIQGLKEVCFQGKDQ